MVLVAAAVLAGWALSIPALISVVPGLATMKANAAVAFLLAGVALIRRKHRDLPLYAIAVFGIAALTLLQYLLRVDFGVDQLLVRDRSSTVDPGRMSQTTGVSFALLGLALILTKAKSADQRRLGRALGLLAGAIGFIALLGYSYDTRALYQVQPFSEMPLHTALAMVIAAVGVQCASENEGLVNRVYADSAGGAMLRRLLPAALFIPYLLGFLVWIAHKQLGWQIGFSLAVVVAGTILCLVLLMLMNARRLERDDLKLRRTNRALIERSASLQAQEDLLKIFVSHVPAAVAMLDRKMHYLQVSERWCSEYSLSSSQILGRSHYEAFPDLPERWKEIHRRGLAGETLRCEEDHWERRKTGATWSRWEVRPWGSRDGLPEGILIFSEDITQRKLMETERQKFVSLADHSSEFIGMCDMGFKPFYVNAAGQRLVGLDSLEQACAVRVQDFFFPEDQPFISNEFFPKVVRDGQGEVEVRFRHFKTGEALWMIYNVFQIKGESGQQVGYATVSRDITARKQAEEKLLELNRTLEDRVQERTAQLAAQIQERERMQAVLDEQRAQMTAASKLTSLGEMAGGLAHEINSPLNIIQARASDLHEIAEGHTHVDAAKVLKATNSILRTGQRIMSVVRGLRTFARDGRSDPFERTSIQTILDETLALCREKFMAHGIGVEVGSFDPSLAIECQAVQISQVLLNLLNNAFDAVQTLPEKWVRVEVRAEGEAVSIAVSDSGRGIPTEIAERAFEPFFTTKPIGKGTGLGLGISSAIAEAHHGHLRIDSGGPNTRIVLTIPSRHSQEQGDEYGQSGK